MTRSDTPKIKHPHPLMQQGTPPQDVEQDHILKFTVFRLGGTGAPTHVETLEPPAQFLDPGDIKRLVGGGHYQVKALANQHTSGRTHGSVLAVTNFSWDGQPNIKAPPTSPYAQSAPPQQTIVERAADHMPALVTSIGGLVTAALGFVTEQRNAREAAEQRRREYDDARRREEQAERDRKEATARAEAEERRENERRRDEERRERERAEAEERRAERDRIEQARLDQMRADAEARQARETILLNAVMNRKDPNEALMLTLAQRALNPPAPANPTSSVDSVLDAAKKLKEFTDGDSDEKLMIAGLQALASPAGSQLIDMASGLLGKRRAPEPPIHVVTPEPPPMEQLPPAQVEAPAPEPPAAAPIEPGPVTLN